ncbi:hypothetical protein J3R30DRAFT_1334709 [Lentinula aciculospora]|uniref:RxLR effector protein n=1 Tax=Lentinula aciculospora TaxID=153920 RepID=A0A9W9ALL4_9AGAR|nr:hypothetical protein J3R30DRAFT_1334709 [Lentinula aciculospora]
MVHSRTILAALLAGGTASVFAIPVLEGFRTNTLGYTRGPNDGRVATGPASMPEPSGHQLSGSVGRRALTVNQGDRSPSSGIQREGSLSNDGKETETISATAEEVLERNKLSIAQYGDDLKVANSDEHWNSWVQETKSLLTLKSFTPDQKEDLVHHIRTVHEYAKRMKKQSSMSLIPSFARPHERLNRCGPGWSSPSRIRP